MKVVHGPRENGFRPGVDPLFRTAAHCYGARVLGIVLSGALDDGTNGLALIKRHGGIAVVQTPEDAAVESMPLSAIRNVEVDHVVPAAAMAALVLRYAAEPPSKEKMAMPDRRSMPPDPAEGRMHGLAEGSMPGPPSGFVCPECSGALWELQDGAILRLACHVGHSYSMQALLNGKAAQLEPVLWTALRALEEQAAVLRRAAERADQQQLTSASNGYRAKADDTEKRADILREMLLAEPPPVPPFVEDRGTGAEPARRKKRSRAR
jgi:two-component system chemotaxis response regulator CheB